MVAWPCPQTTLRVAKAYGHGCSSLHRRQEAETQADKGRG